MKNINIIEAIQDNNLFGSLFRDQKTWYNWKVFLKALFGLSMNGQEQAIYRKYTGRNMIPDSVFKEAYLICGRRSGKSLTSAITGCYLALFQDFTQYLSKGEKVYILIIAVDRVQAKIILNYIKGILSLPIFRNEIKKELKSEIELKNNVIIQVATSDYKSVRGFTAGVVIIDELAFIRNQGVTTDIELINALRPSMITIPNSLLIALSSPYAKQGVLYNVHKKYYGVDNKNILVWQAPTLAMNPTIDKKIIRNAYENDKSVAESEYGANFRADLETFISSEIIDELVYQNRYELPYQLGKKYFAFCDPSGGAGKDSMSLAIVYQDQDKIILSKLIESKPPFKPKEVVKQYSDILKEYELKSVQGDRYTGAWCLNEFKDNEITYNVSTLNKSQIYLEFEPVCNQGGVELLDHEKMINQFKLLERRTRSGGKDLVDHPRGGHDDLINAVAGAVVLAKGKKVINAYSGFSEEAWC